MVNERIIAINSTFLGLGITILIIGLVTAFFRSKKDKFRFTDLIREADGYPSLARLQFLCWTIIVIFCFTTASMVRLLGGLSEPPGATMIPENLLLLMGISVSVTPISAYMTNAKYGDPKPEDLKRSKLDSRPWSSMLLENKMPSLSRFQMLSWTVLSIILYFSSFYIQLATLDISQLGNFNLPDIDFTMVALMGLSQGAYIGGKFVSSTSVLIKEIIPDEIEFEKIEDTIITISGKHFGTEKGILWVGKDRVDENDISKWNNEIIEFKLDKIKPGPKKGTYKVKILVGTKEATEEFEIVQ